VHKTIPIHLDPTSGDIQVGRTTYPGANPGMHLLALKRQPQVDPTQQDTVELISDHVFTDKGAANQFLTTTLANTGDALVIANGVGSYGFYIADIGSSLQQFGGQVDLTQAAFTGFFIFIGNGGLNKGGALQRCCSTFPIDGYLALDSNSNYKFIQTDYVPYDIGLDGTIKIGNNTYTVATSTQSDATVTCTANAFRLVVVDRESLNIAKINNIPMNKTYCTAESDNSINELAADLGNVNQESQLAFVGMAGNAIPANWSFGTDGDARFVTNGLAQDIASLGGYYETIVYLSPTDTYSLVGAGQPPSWVSRPRSRARESSSVYPGHPSGELHGVLARGRGNWYSPVNADTSGTANLDFYDKVLAQVAVPAASSTVPNANYTFPPYTTDANYSDEAAAFASISTQICQATEGDNNPDCSTFNPRNNYANTNIAISNYLINLQDIKGPGGADCSQSTNSGLAFCQVWRQLSTEFQDVANIRNFQANLGKLGTIQGEDDLFDLINTWQTVEATLPTPPPSNATAGSLVSPIVNLVLGVGASAPTPLAPLFGLVDTFFNFGESLTTDPSGNQTASLAGPVANLANQAQDNFHAQLDTLGTQFGLIYENWAKMQPLGAFLASGAPAWSWGDPTTTASEISSRLNPAIKQSMYRSLLPAVYAIGSYVPNTPHNCSGNGGPNGWPVWGQTPLWQEPNAYGVEDGSFNCGGNEPVVQPFNVIEPNYIPYTYPTDSTNNFQNDLHTGTILASGSWLAISLQSSPKNGGSTGTYTPPDASLLSTLFTPVGQNSPEGNPGLGVYRPAFFEGWPFPRVTCDPSWNDSNGYQINGGCNWSATAPTLEALPQPMAKVSIATISVSKGKTQTTVVLAVHNSGTKGITSLEITNVATVSGHSATLIAPALPIHIGAISPGTYATVNLTLDVPRNVKDLQLTETGTASSDDGSTSAFNLQQVILSKK
jgi:hypothetical protein